MGKLKVIAAVVDTRQLTLYDIEGNSTIIPQGDPRVRKIIDEVLPVVQTGGIAEVDLDTQERIYQDFEEKTGGAVRFFRMAKAKLKGFFGTKDEEQAVAPTGSYGLPSPVGMVKDSTGIVAGGSINQPFNLDRPAIEGINGPTLRPRDQAQADINKAVDEIMSHAQPIAAVSTPINKDTESVVAVVETQEGKRIIPDVDQLKNHFNHANLKGSTAGIQNLLKRLGAIIHGRQHSVEDVLRFLERADLPIADDGTVIAYKVLRTDGAKKGRYVDCHTGRVSQAVGSKVVVDESMVDKNRRNECSNGLHVARRSYLTSFHGDVCTIIKVAPEDIITVPHRDANKVRVCAYHIIAELDNADYLKVRSDKPMTDSDNAQQILARAIAGEHVGVLEEVRINGQKGTNVVITDYRKDKPAVQPVKEIVVPEHATAIEPVAEPGKLDAPAVNPKEVATKASEIQEEQDMLNPRGSRKQKAAHLAKIIMNTRNPLNVQRDAARALRKLSKLSKVNYITLGVDRSTIKAMELLLKDEPAPVKTSKATKAVTAALKGEVVSPPKPAKAKQDKLEPEETVISTAEALANPELSYEQLLAIKLTKEGKLSKSEVSRQTGIHRRSIERLVAKFG